MGRKVWSELQVSNMCILLGPNSTGVSGVKEQTSLKMSMQVELVDVAVTPMPVITLEVVLPAESSKELYRCKN